MKTLHLYLIRQVLGTLVMTVVVFTFVMLLVNALKEVLALLVNGQLDLATLLQAIGMLVPWVLPFALPMGMLTAALLVFGRFSADNELNAVRASGVSLIALVAPVLFLSVCLCGVVALINLELGPRCRVAYRKLLFEVSAAQAVNFIPEQTYLKDFNTNVIVYISKVRGSNLEDVLALRLRDNRCESLSRAERGVVFYNPSNRVFTVVLSNAVQVMYREEDRLPQALISDTAEFAFTNATPRVERWRSDLSDMTFSQLRQELRSLEERLQSSQSTQSTAVVEKLSTVELRAKMQQLKSQKNVDLTMPVRVQLHRQVAFSFACLGFTPVGIPLGIQAHRRETNFGIALALVLVVIYYSFFILGLSLETRPELAPHLILWLPNFLFQSVGVVLLWRANRGA